MRKSIWSRLGKSILVISVALPLMTGCWDRQEIEERAVVLGIAVDDVEPDSEKTEEVSHLKGSLPAPDIPMVKVTMQIAVPGRIPLGPGGGGGGGGDGRGGSKTVWIVDAMGSTVDDAINVLQQRVASPLFFGHLRVIVVSEAIAKRGMQNLNDYFRRNPDVRRMNWMIISKGKASQFMRNSPQLERVPTLYLLTTMDQAVKMGRFPNDFLGIFWSSLSAKGKEGYLPYAEIRKGDTIEIKGLAYFKDDRMVGKTEPLETTLYMEIKGTNPAGGALFVQVPGSDEYVEFLGRDRKSITKVRIVNGQPHVYVRIYVEGNLLEKANEEVTLSDDVIDQVQQQLSKKATKAYQDLIRKTQRHQSDIFGFGEYVRAKQAAYWNANVKTKGKWQEIYKDLPVEITAKFSIRRVGMKAT